MSKLNIIIRIAFIIAMSAISIALYINGTEGFIEGDKEEPIAMFLAAFIFILIALGTVISTINKFIKGLDNDE